MYITTNKNIAIVDITVAVLYFLTNFSFKLEFFLAPALYTFIIDFKTCSYGISLKCSSVKSLTSSFKYFLVLNTLIYFIILIKHKITSDIQSTKNIINAHARSTDN